MKVPPSVGIFGPVKEIDHNPNEKRPTNTIWWIAWLIVAMLWIGTGYFFGYDWRQIALGALSATVLTGWAVEITGNKVPESWRNKPPRR